MRFKKPKFWDLKKPNLISHLLLPITFITKISNFVLDKKLTKKFEKIKTICVGNIYLGGTGKTPTVIKLYELLRTLNFDVSIGKKFYFNHLDEKKLLEKKVKLITSNNRKKVVEKAVKINQNVIVFDDGLQDKDISYDLQFVCFDSDNWIGNGRLIPAGPLRENVSSLKKYDAVFLKHSAKLENHVKNLINDINPDIKIFNTLIKINNLDKFDLSKKYLIFSGIGSPGSFKKTLAKYNFDIVDEFIFPDHYNYKTKDIEIIKKRAKNLEAKIITTEKDYVKISQTDSQNIDFIEVDLNIVNQEELINFLKLRLNE
ncbi:tetraacyldisaccharide 4'-kinase [Candidatus Pelagibacter sp.]|nr:tetraacyldisaccharide 4'-kinase [Candidatus Pelagibacter sp.]